MATESLTLTDADVRSFRDRGYLLPQRHLFAPPRLRELTGLFEEHLADKGDKRADELDTPHWHDPRLLDFLLGEEVLDLVEPLLGPDIVLWSSHFISKDPEVGRGTPWHTDADYWQGRVDDDTHIVTVWLSLDGSDSGNGCMRVIPGSHEGPRSTYVRVPRAANTFGRQIEQVDESKAVDFVLEPGQVSLHDARLIHGARPNTSHRRRTGYTMRYLPASVRVIPEANPGFQVWLARGKDRAGNSYQNVPG